MSGTACLKITYVIVRWVSVQAVPFSLCIDLSLFDHIYSFEDGTIPPSANLQSGLLNVHSFRVYLYTVSAIRRRNWRRKAPTASNTELDD